MFGTALAVLTHVPSSGHTDMSWSTNVLTESVLDGVIGVMLLAQSPFRTLYDKLSMCRSDMEIVKWEKEE